MNDNTLVKYTMTYGLYLGIAFSVVVMILKYAGNIHFPGDTAGMINAMLLSVGMVYFGRKYRDTLHKGEFLYKSALGFSVLLTLFSAVIYTFFSYWYYTVIEPNGISYYIEQMHLAYTQNGTFSDEQLSALVDLYNNMLTPGIMAFIVFFSQSLIGVLLGLVMSVFIKSPVRITQNNY
jgi:hypothetical protein